MQWYQVEELRDPLLDPTSEDEGYESPPPEAPTSTSSSSPHLMENAAVFGHRAIASSLQRFYPSLPQAGTWRIFIDLRHIDQSAKQQAEEVRIHTPSLKWSCGDSPLK